MKSAGRIAAAVALALALTASWAVADNNHPLKANKFLVLFVRAYNQCTSFDTTHNPPLPFPACSDPLAVSSQAQFGPKGFGQAKGVLERFLDCLGVGFHNPEALVIRLLGIVTRQVNQRAFFPALRHENVHPRGAGGLTRDLL